MSYLSNTFRVESDIFVLFPARALVSVPRAIGKNFYETSQYGLMCNESRTNTSVNDCLYREKKTDN
jgi:hypothetical protein